MKLYEIVGAYREVESMLYDEEADEQVIFDTLESIQDEFERKADSLARLDKQIKGDIETIDKEIKRLQAKKQTLENRSESLFKYLKDSMEAIGKRNIKTPLFSFNIRKKGGKLKMNVTENIKMIPDEFLMPQPPKADNEKIRKYLETGAEVEWANLEPRGEYLSIK